MASECRPYKEKRKIPFIKALTRIGTIAGAARAVRISRYAVHDWIRDDASFGRLVLQAKRRHADRHDLGIETALEFFEVVAQRAVPRQYWARMSAELAIAAANLKNDLKADGMQCAVPSGKKAEFPLSPNRFVDVAIPHRGNGNSAVNL